MIAKSDLSDKKQHHMHFFCAKRNFLLLAFSLVLGSCHNKKNPQELPFLAWQPVDSVFSCYIEKDGDSQFKTGDLLGIELIGVIDKANNQFIPAVQIDSTYGKAVTRLSGGLLDKNLDSKFRKNSEGYIKADLSKVFPDFRVVVSAYVKENVSQLELDSLIRNIKLMKEVHGVKFISKDDAKQEFIKNGNADFTSVLDSNPLPASIEITVKDEFCSSPALLRLKEKLESENPFTIEEIKVPQGIFAELKMLRSKNYIFRFKT